LSKFRKSLVAYQKAHLASPLVDMQTLLRSARPNGSAAAVAALAAPFSLRSFKHVDAVQLFFGGSHCWDKAEHAGAPHLLAACEEEKEVLVALFGLPFVREQAVQCVREIEALWHNATRYKAFKRTRSLFPQSRDFYLQQSAAQAAISRNLFDLVGIGNRLKFLYDLMRNK